MLELIAVSKRYDAIQALAPTDIAFAAGSTTALVGPSGCGKSTLLRLVAGLLAPDTGKVVFEGETLGPRNVLRARLRMGYVIQEGGLFPHLSVHRNVTLMARYLGRPEDEVRRRVAELAELVRLDPGLLERHPDALSGGQRQRASLMRALMLDPDLLLLDEPLGALDPMIRVELQRELKAIFERLGKTVLLVTHDLAEAAFLARRMVLMRAGRVIQSGTLAELARRPAEPFVEAFVNAQREPMARLAELLQ